MNENASLPGMFARRFDVLLRRRPGGGRQRRRGQSRQHWSGHYKASDPRRSSPGLSTDAQASATARRSSCAPTSLTFSARPGRSPCAAICPSSTTTYRARATRTAGMARVLGDALAQVLLIKTIDQASGVWVRLAGDRAHRFVRSIRQPKPALSSDSRIPLQPAGNLAGLVLRVRRPIRLRRHRHQHAQGGEQPSSSPRPSISHCRIRCSSPSTRRPTSATTS